jgi:hypothetical protein
MPAATHAGRVAIVTGAGRGVAMPIVAAAGGAAPAAVIAGTPAAVVRAVRFPAGPEAACVTGRTIGAAGGWMMT